MELALLYSILVVLTMACVAMCTVIRVHRRDHAHLARAVFLLEQRVSMLPQAPKPLSRTAFTYTGASLEYPYPGLDRRN